MAYTNFTGGGNRTTFKELFCSLGLSAGIYILLIFLSVLNVFLSIISFLGNTLILIALHKETSLHPPSKLLYRTLATTDLCVGLIVEPLHVTYMLSSVNEEWNTCGQAFDAAFITGSILCLVSLFTSTAISVDRLLALLLGLRYRQVVTLRRTFITITAVWVLSIVGTAMDFWNHIITRWYGCITISFCLVASIVSYTKIFFTLRHHQNQVQGVIHQEQPRQTIPINIARYRKAVFSALWVQLTLVVCYLPFSIVVIWLTKNVLPPLTYLTLFSVTTTLVYLNSSLNPALYCWRMKEVRQAVKGTIGQICSLFS